jgi:prepilin-type N-terminal cleavage/methylation domain-containing protein
MNQARKHRGFTLIELMLAMAFVSALLLAIAMTVIQISNIYNSGLTYKSVNQYGGALANELQRDISQSTPFDTTKSFVPQVYLGVITGGRLCIGQYSYIWNYGKALAGGAPTLNTYSASGTPPINFVKAVDSEGIYCSNPAKKIDSNTAVELLNVGQVNLALQNFLITQISHDSSTGQYLYAISFVIGTNDQTALNTSSTGCLTSDSISSNPTYCAVNQFDIVARAGSNSSSTSD